MKKENYFDLNKTLVIWIYGAGNIGENYCRKLLNAGYNVGGFLDQNADSMGEICKRQVLLPDEAEKIVSEDTVVIISLRNGLQQETIAEKLALVGLTKIIYLPMHIKQSLFVRRQYRLNYEHLLNGDFSQILQEPVFGCETYYPDCMVIRETKDKIAFWCKNDDLYSAAFIEEETQKMWQVNQCTMEKYVDRKINELTPYVELFQYLRGEQADIGSYMEMQGRVTQEQRALFLEDRRILYQVYERAYKFEMNFFTDLPSVCIWNEKGYFNMQDGMHRAQYLISKGYTEVPIIVAKGDFEKYIQNGVKRCKQ